MIIMLVLLGFATVSAALMGDMVRLTAPAAFEQIATIPGASKEPDHNWVAITRTVEPLAVDPGLLAAPESIQQVLGVPRASVAGTPLATGRLRTASEPPIIDKLTCTLEKEEKLHGAALGLAVDALLLTWAEHLLNEGCEHTFETLAASSSLFSEEALTSRGFKPIDEPDFTAMARGEPIATHTARLPSALMAAKARAAKVDEPTDDSGGVSWGEMDREYAASLVAALSKLAPPQTEFVTKAPDKPKKDPWAGIKGFGMS